MNRINYFLSVLLVACSGGLNETPVDVLPTEDQIFTKYCPPSGILAKTAPQEPIRIVAIGSSTTEGVGATDPKWNYVSRLRIRLENQFPGRSIEVVNAGRGGENIFMISERYTRDVIEARPNLVILQTGINDALQKVNMEKFSKALNDIVQKNTEANISMILMGNQYLGENELTKVPQLMEFENTIRNIAATNLITMIDRHDLFRDLVKYNYATMDKLYASDFLHFSDLGYEKLEICVYRSYSSKI